MRANHFIFYLLILFLPIGFSARAQSSKPVFVIVHGAWGGSWAFKKVDSILTDKGCTVYRPSLTGLGERVHLSNAQIGLQTHIDDVVNTILYENLHDVVLVGHSYGGMVVTGVADSIPDRIKKLIYVDAFLPQDGESAMNIAGDRAAFFKSLTVNGFIIPVWAQPGTPLPHDVPMPLKTFTDMIHLKHLTNKIPVVYILTVDSGADPAKDDFASQAERAKTKGYKVLQLTADHNPQWSATKAFSDMLFDNR